MKKYTIGLITGALLAVSAMMFMGAQNKNLGDITVTSIKALNDDGDMVGFFGSLNDRGALALSRAGNSLPEIILVLEDAGGTIGTCNADGKETVYLGNGEGGNGFLTTNNADGKKTAYLGTGEDGIGLLGTFNADGKQTVYLGTSEGGFGFLSTYNKHEVKTGYFGTNKDNDGIAVLFDRYGDIGWSAIGKQ